MIGCRQRYCKRNAHSVDFAAVRSMYGRWEVDNVNNVVVLPPHGCDDIDHTRPHRLLYFAVVFDNETRDTIIRAFPPQFPVRRCTSVPFSLPPLILGLLTPVLALSCT